MFEGIGGSTRAPECALRFGATNQKDGNNTFRLYGKPFTEELPHKMTLNDPVHGEQKVEFSLFLLSVDMIAAFGATGATSFLDARGYRPSPTSSMDARLAARQDQDGFLFFVGPTNLTVEFSQELESKGHFESGKEYLNTGLKAPCCGIPFTKIWQEGMHAAARVFATGLGRSFDALSEVAGGENSSGVVEAFRTELRKYSTYNPQLRRHRQTGQWIVGNMAPTFFFSMFKCWSGFMSAITAAVMKVDPTGSHGYLEDLRFYFELVRGALLCFFVLDEKKSAAAAYGMQISSYYLLAYHLFLFGRAPPSMLLLPGETAVRVADIVKAGLSPRAVLAESVEHSHQISKKHERLHGGLRGGVKPVEQRELDVLGSKLPAHLHEMLVIPKKITGKSRRCPAHRVTRAKKKATNQLIPDLSTFAPGEPPEVLLGPGDVGFKLYGPSDAAATAENTRFCANASVVGQGSTITQVPISSCDLGNTTLISSETAGIIMHMYKSKSRPSFELTDGKKHSTGLKIPIKYVYKWLLTTTGVLFVQLADAPLLLRGKCSNMGVTPSIAAKFWNLKIQVAAGDASALQTEWGTFTAHWAAQHPHLMIANPTARSTAQRPANIFRGDMTNFSDALAAYKAAKAVDDARYTTAPMSTMPRQARETCRNLFIRGLREWRQRKSSVRFNCPFCMVPCFIKHPTFVGGDIMPGAFTISKPHTSHDECESHFIYGTGPEVELTDQERENLYDEGDERDAVQTGELNADDGEEEDGDVA
jgi:hypothetical protein